MTTHGNMLAQRPTSGPRRSLALICLFSLFGGGAGFGQVTPGLVQETLAPGESIEIEKTVCTPEILPNLEVYFLADTTGSMGAVLNSVKTSASALLTALAPSTVGFGAGNYRDFPHDAFAYQNNASIGSAAAAQAAINAWIAGGGADGPEGQLYALDQIADPGVGVGFSLANPTITPVVVWFGDAPGHDPICHAMSGVGYNITEASVTAKLVAAGIRVVAISTTTGYPNGLNDDPASTSTDYGACGPAGGLPNQGSRIAAATGGSYLQNVPANQIAAAILAGIKALPVTVSPVLQNCDHLQIDISPASQEVISGSCAVFRERITVLRDAPECDALLGCRVGWAINGEIPGPDFVQGILITVPDVTPPQVACVETVNPAGKHVPTAGKNPKSGQNPDGFYELLARDNCDAAPSVYLVDAGSGVFFGPFWSGVKVKITQAPGKTPSIKPMAGEIDHHIFVQGDPYIVAYDASGNLAERAACFVPPPPK